MRGIQWLVLLGLAGLLQTVPVEAQDEWQVCPSEGIQTFLGLDDTSVPTQVREGRAQALQNVLLDVSQSLTKRHGIKVVGDTCDDPDDDFPPITGLAYTKFSSGTERIVRTCDNQFQYYNPSTRLWVDETGTGNASGSFVITEGATNQFVWTTALDQLVGTNDANTPIQYDGTTLTVVDFTDMAAASGIQRAKTVAFFKNYLIFANTVENGVSYPTRFRWSNVGTVNDWTDANFIDIGALGGQEINAVAELYDNLYFFLTNSIYKLSLVGGVDTWQVSKVSDTIGSIAKNSVQTITLANAQTGVVFLDRHKRLYFFNGIFPQDISVNITQAMENLTASQLPYAVSGDTGTDYWLCVNDVDTTMNDLCFDLQYQIGEWTKHTNIHANAMARVLDTNANSHVYFGNYHGLTYQLSDENLRADVGYLEALSNAGVAFTATVDGISTFNTLTASFLPILYDDALNLVTGALVGAPILLVDGTGDGATGIVVDNTITGIVVASAFSTTPDTTTQFEVGGIDAFYTTKWYDMRQPARLKAFGEVYFWADADVTSSLVFSHATNFNATTGSETLALTSATSDTTWGDAVVGAPLYGSADSVMRIGKVEGSGRFFRAGWADDDPNDVFRLYGWNCLYKMGELQ